MLRWLNKLLIPAIFATIFIVLPVLVITLSGSDKRVLIEDSGGLDSGFGD